MGSVRAGVDEVPRQRITPVWPYLASQQKVCRGNVRRPSRCERSTVVVVIMSSTLVGRSFGDSKRTEKKPGQSNCIRGNCSKTGLSVRWEREFVAAQKTAEKKEPKFKQSAIQLLFFAKYNTF